MVDRTKSSMGFFLVIAMVLVKGGGGLLTLNPPPECYESCMSQTLGEMGCEFDDLPCWCGAGNTNFLGPMVGCVDVNCDSSDASSGQTFVESACAVLSAGQSTLPASLATLIPEATGVTATSNSPAVATATTTSSFTGSSTTNAVSTVSPNAASQTASTADADTSVSDHSDGTGTSTGVLIGAIVGGIIGFLILALIIISVVLYILVRRSVEKRARDREHLRESKLYNEEGRSSVAASGSASDTPEDELREMEPSFWGVVTRPKQALRVVNG